MHLKTLGGLELTGTEAPRSLSRPKPLLLLAYLAVEGAKERHHLAELFWPEAAMPLNSLRVAVSQLRSVGTGVIRSGQGPRGATTLSTGVACDTAALLSALDSRDGGLAAELYKGPFLDGFYLRDIGSELEDWVYATREYIASRVQLALLQQAERTAHMGAYADASRIAAAAFAATSEHDVDVLRRAHRLLAAGGHALALTAAREAGAYELRLDAGSEEARRSLASAAPEGVPNNLPTPLTSFIGRDLELIALGNLLSSGTRLVTVIGVGGVGKSRLALAVAAAAVRDGLYADGVFLVELTAVPGPELVLDAIASALGAPPGDHADDRVSRALSGKRVLLLLDDFEHVIEAATSIKALLASNAGLAVLVTSREPLELTGEQLYRLDALAPVAEEIDVALGSDAVALFRSVARRTDLSFEVDASNWEAVLRICEAVHRLPLGIELAAASNAGSDLEDLADVLSVDSSALTSEKRDTAPRHRSLTATIEHSWRLLSQREREALARVSVFSGGFTRDAAAHVAGANLSALRALSAKALLQESGAGRFDAHPLVRDYAAMRLAEDQAASAAIHAAHATYFADLACRAEEPLKGGDQGRWLGLLEDDLANLRRALSTLVDRRGDRATEGNHLALAALGATWQFWLRRGRLAEGRAWYEAALEASPLGEHLSLRAKALTGAAVLAFEQRDLADSERLNLEALRIRRDIGDRLGEARSLYNLAGEAGVRGDLALAEERLTAAIAVFDELGDGWSQAFALNNLAMLQRDQGRDEDAAASLRVRLRMQKELGDEVGIAHTLCGLADISLATGNVPAARQVFHEALALADKCADVTGTVSALEGLAVAMWQSGEPATSAQLLGRAQALREAHNMQADLPDAVPAALLEALEVELGIGLPAELAAGSSLDEAAALAVTAVAPPSPRRTSDG